MTATSLTTTSATAIAVTDEELQVLRETLNPDLSPAELRLFALVAKRSGLDVFCRQIYAVKRKGRVTFQVGIDGLRSIAARTGEYDGQDPPQFGPRCACGEPPANHPEFCTVTVYRRGMSRGVAATAFWHEYKPAPGPSGEQDAMWRRMPRVMLAKVAEALALRKGFPWDPTRGVGIGGEVYSSDEMSQADATPAPIPLTARERLAARRAELHPADPPTTEVTGGDRPDGADNSAPARNLTLEAFLALVTAAGISRAAVAAAADEVFPGVRSRDYTDAHWGAVADRLGLPRDDVEEAEDPEPAPSAATRGD